MTGYLITYEKFFLMLKSFFGPKIPDYIKDKELYKQLSEKLPKKIINLMPMLEHIKWNKS